MKLTFNRNQCNQENRRENKNKNKKTAVKSNWILKIGEKGREKRKRAKAQSSVDPMFG